MECDIEYNFRVCPIRIITATDDEVLGPFSPVLHHTIAQPHDEIDSVMSRIGSHHMHAGAGDDHHYVSGSSASGRGITSTLDSNNGGPLLSLMGDNGAGKLLYKVTTMYKNRDKFSDQQKAMIYVAILMAAALICAAVVEMFLR